MRSSIRSASTALLATGILLLHAHAESSHHVRGSVNWNGLNQAIHELDAWIRRNPDVLCNSASAGTNLIKGLEGAIAGASGNDVSGLAIASIIGTVANITDAPDNIISTTEAALKQTTVGGATGPDAFSAAMGIAKAGPSRIICELIAGQKGNDDGATELIQDTERLFTFGNSIADDINEPINEATNKVKRLFKNMKSWF